MDFKRYEMLKNNYTIPLVHTNNAIISNTTFPFYENNTIIQREDQAQ